MYISTQTIHDESVKSSGLRLTCVPIYKYIYFERTRVRLPRKYTTNVPKFKHFDLNLYYF